MSKLHQLIIPFALALLLSACAGQPSRLMHYDFGVVSQPVSAQLSCHLPPVYLADITAPGALNNHLMSYRLLYADDMQTRAYANSRWSMRPAELLAQRIKAQLAQNGVTVISNGIKAQANWQLRLELNDFTHYFSDSAHSYAQLQLRATALRGNVLVAQTTFTRQVDADAADAPSGARAMRAATDELITDLYGWLCEQISG